MQAKQESNFDLVIVGAGIAGLQFLHLIVEAKELEIKKATSKLDLTSSDSSSSPRWALAEEQEPQIQKQPPTDTATLLSKKPFRVLLLDMKDRLGGRVCTFQAGKTISKTTSKRDLQYHFSTLADPKPAPFTTPTKENEDKEAKEAKAINKAKEKDMPEFFFEGGPSRFSARHSELLSLIKRLGLKVNELNSSPGPYLALRVPFRNGLEKDRAQLSEQVMKAYGLSDDPVLVKWLDQRDRNANKIFVQLTQMMDQDFRENPNWSIRYSGVSFMKFSELMMVYLALSFDLFRFARPPSSSSSSSSTSSSSSSSSSASSSSSSPGSLPRASASSFPPELLQTFRAIAVLKQRLGTFMQKPQGLLQLFSPDAVKRAKAISFWLIDSLGYCAELEMGAVFGRGLISEISQEQKWLTLDLQEPGQSGLQGLISHWADNIWGRAMKLKTELDLHISLGQQLMSLSSRQKQQDWILKCSSQIDGHADVFLAKEVVFTGSNANLKLAYRPSVRELLRGAGLTPSATPSQPSLSLPPTSVTSLTKIPAEILFDYVFKSTIPRVLLRVFAQFPRTPLSSSPPLTTRTAPGEGIPILQSELKGGGFWFDGVPRIISSGPLRMSIPMQAGKHGIFQISYTDWRYSHPWLKLLDEGRKNKTVTPPTPTNVDFGYASANSAFGKEIYAELRKLFPEIHIPQPLGFIYHPCICHYQQPEEFSAVFQEELGAQIVQDSAMQPRYRYTQLGEGAANPLPGLFLCGEAYNNQYNTKIPNGWMESALRSAILTFQAWQRLREATASGEERPNPSPIKTLT